MARTFAGPDHNVALCARRTDRMESLRAELQTAHSGVIVETRELDVNDHDQVFKVFGEFRKVLELQPHFVI